MPSETSAVNAAYIEARMKQFNRAVDQYGFRWLKVRCY